MSKPKNPFTPGPWSINYNENADVVRVLDSRGFRIMSDEQVGDQVTQSESIANARLIAAAPEMYEALQSAHRMLTILFNEYNYGDSGLIRECGEALSKARGET